MKSRYKVTLTRPAKAMSDAFLLGNGRLGAVFHGSPGEERLDLNLDSVWSGGPGAPQSSPDVGVLPALRGDT